MNTLGTGSKVRLIIDVAVSSTFLVATIIGFFVLKLPLLTAAGVAGIAAATTATIAGLLALWRFS